ncbi:hypothetical protein [Mizugakiibacter sediminis]|uniref:Phage FDXHR zinc binding domain-containing protein n=1 Tax=Mizugakiibacter sediminis TaxID=1475481 RepID=A0A0S6YX95_9GAMM|nr:hypothetical protein [Mizugakiibacter sediminis]
MKPRDRLPLTGNRCQCPACGEYFSRVRAFDRHRVGTVGIGRRCLAEAEMIARGWQRNAAGYWVTTALDGAGRRRLAVSGGLPATTPPGRRRTPARSRNLARSRGGDA